MPLVDEMRATSKVIKLLEIEYQKNRIELQEMEHDLRVMEFQCYAEVCECKGADGKSAYSNDRLRDAEVQKRLVSNATYKKKKDSKNVLELKQNTSVIPDLEFDKREFRILEIECGR